MGELLSFEQEQNIFKGIEKNTNSAFDMLKRISLPVPTSRDRNDLIIKRKELESLSKSFYVSKQEAIKNNEPIPQNNHTDILTIISLLNLAVEGKDMIFFANDRLVKNITYSFSNRKQHIEDIQQEAYIGLMRAIDKFDYRLNLKFSTYSFLWIKQGGMRYLAEHSRTIRLPCYISEWRSKISKMTDRYVLEVGRAPTKEEIIKELSLTKKQLEMFDDAIKNEACFSLEVDQNSDGEKGKRDGAMFKKVHKSLLEQYSPENIHDKLEIENIDNIISKFLHPMEEMVIRLRYGIVSSSDRDFAEGGESMTYSRISKKIGTCVESVRKTEKRAIKKIKERLNEKH